MYIDLRYRSTERLEEVARIAEKLGYRIIGVEGLDKVQVLNGITFIPRRTSSDISELVKIKRNVLRAYLIRSPEDLKSYPRLRKLAVIVSLSRTAFHAFTPKHVERLAVLGLPVEVAIRDVYEAVRERRYLRGLDYLVSAARSGRLELVACSGASKNIELLHPKIIISTLIELGLDEVTALKAVTSAPAKVARGLGYGIK